MKSKRTAEEMFPPLVEMRKKTDSKKRILLKKKKLSLAKTQEPLTQKPKAQIYGLTPICKIEFPGRSACLDDYPGGAVDFGVSKSIKTMDWHTETDFNKRPSQTTSKYRKARGSNESAGTMQHSESKGHSHILNLKLGQRKQPQRQMQVKLQHQFQQQQKYQLRQKREEKKKRQHEMQGSEEVKILVSNLGRKDEGTGEDVKTAELKTELKREEEEEMPYFENEGLHISETMVKDEEDEDYSSLKALNESKSHKLLNRHLQSGYGSVYKDMFSLKSGEIITHLREQIDSRYSHFSSNQITPTAQFQPLLSPPHHSHFSHQQLLQQQPQTKALQQQRSNIFITSPAFKKESLKELGHRSQSSFHIFNKSATTSSLNIPPFKSPLPAKNEYDFTLGSTRYSGYNSPQPNLPKNRPISLADISLCFKKLLHKLSNQPLLKKRLLKFIDSGEEKYLFYCDCCPHCRMKDGEMYKVRYKFKKTAQEKYDTICYDQNTFVKKLESYEVRCFIIKSVRTFSKKFSSLLTQFIKKILFFLIT